MISIVILTKNEEKMIADAIRSSTWADEVVVIDTGSKDKTIETARKLGARIVEYKEGKNYSDWRNKGIEVAKGDWILYLDADERVTPLLKKEIQAIVSNPNETLTAFAIPRRNFIFDKEFKHSGQYPDYQRRLFSKKNLERWTGIVHEEPQYIGELGHLKNAMIHLKNLTISQMMDKTNWWSGFEANLMYKSDHPPMNVVRFLSAMTREFWLRMIVQAAYLDGVKGIIYALYQVYSRFVSYAKLWEMQQK